MGLDIFGTGINISNIRVDEANLNKFGFTDGFNEILETALSGKELSDSEKIAKFKKDFAPRAFPNPNIKYLKTMADAMQMLKKFWQEGSENIHRVMKFKDHIREQIGNTMYIYPVDVPKQSLQDGDMFILRYTPPPPEVVTNHVDGSRSIDEEKYNSIMTPGQAGLQPAQGAKVFEQLKYAQLLKDENERNLIRQQIEAREIEKQAFDENTEKEFVVQQPRQEIRDNSIWLVPEKYFALKNGKKFKWTKNHVEVLNQVKNDIIEKHQDSLMANSFERLTRIANNETPGSFFTQKNMQDTKSLLQSIGVDTTGDFYINGKRFWFDAQDNLVW